VCGNLLGGHRLVKFQSTLILPCHAFVLNFILQNRAPSDEGKSPAGVGFKRAKFHVRKRCRRKVQIRVWTHLYVCWSAYQTSTLRLRSETQEKFISVYCVLYKTGGKRLHKEATRLNKFMTEWEYKNLISSNDDRRKRFSSLFFIWSH
jgi:hypothetical protein